MPLQNALDKAALKLHLRDPTMAESLQQDAKDAVTDCCPSLSLEMRVIGVVACFGIGAVLSFLSLLTIPKVLQGDPTPFALLYTSGNIVSLSGSLFLVGPVRQVKNMFKKSRWLASIMYILAMSATLFCVFYDGLKPTGLKMACVFIAIFLQFIALVWYALSYVPFGRTCVKKVVGACCP